MWFLEEPVAQCNTTIYRDRKHPSVFLMWWFSETTHSFFGGDNNTLMIATMLVPLQVNWDPMTHKHQIDVWYAQNQKYGGYMLYDPSRDSNGLILTFKIFLFYPLVAPSHSMACNFNNSCLYFSLKSLFRCQSRTSFPSYIWQLRHINHGYTFGIFYIGSLERYPNCHAHCPSQLQEVRSVIFLIP